MQPLSIHFTMLKIKMINPYGGGYSGSFKILYTAMQIKRKQKKRLEKKRETISNKKEKKRKKDKKRKRSIKN